MEKWNNKLQGVINKLILRFTLQIWTKIQSTTFLSPNLAIIQSWKDHYHNLAQIHKHKYNIILHKNWTKIRIGNWKWVEGLRIGNGRFNF
jgi:hypothetical protein